METVKKNAQNSYLIADWKSKKAVEKVERVLGNLKEEGIIWNFGQTPFYGRDDRWGIDIFIFPFSGKEIKLQVKASYHRKVEEKYRRRRIFLIGVPPNCSSRNIKKKILKILDKAKRSKKRASFF